MDDLHLEADRLFGPCSDPDCPGSAVRQTSEESSSYPRKVALTRRTARFGELAAQVEERLDQLGIVVDPTGVDAGIRDQVRATAEQLGVTDRTALRYVPDAAADDLARQYVLLSRTVAAQHNPDGTVAVPAGSGRDRGATPGRRRHLRLVR